MSQRGPQTNETTTAHRAVRLGNYELLGAIAEGGMGRVYRARHVLLDKLAAVKVLKPGLPGKDQLLERFRKEAHALARVTHPNVVQVLDIGEHNGVTYIAMDFAPGMDLARWLKRDGRLAAANFEYVAKQVMAAIAAAHAAGMLHRDIKPDNIIVDHTAQVKITDFGIAADARLSGMTVEKQAFATRAYAAPEVLRGGVGDARSDVFSLGATLYHAATGQLPFGKGSTSSVLDAQEKGAPALASIEPDVTPTLSKAIMRSLSLKPSDRPGDAGQMLEEAFPSGPKNRATLFVTVAAAAVLVLALAGIAWAIWFKPGANAGGNLPAANKNTGIPSPANLPAPTPGKRDSQPHLPDETQPPSPVMRNRAAEAAWERTSAEVNSIDVPQGYAERIRLLDTFLRQYEGTRSEPPAAALLSADRKNYLAARQDAYGKLVATTPAMPPRAAVAAINALPEWLLEDTPGIQDKLAERLDELRTLAEGRSREMLDAALAGAARLAEARALLDARARLVSVQPLLIGQPTELTAARATLDQRIAEAHAKASQITASARHEALATRGRAAVRLRDSLETVNAALIGCSFNTARTQLAGLREKTPASLMPALEMYAAEAEQVAGAYTWLIGRVAALKGKDFELTAYTDETWSRFDRKVVGSAGATSETLRVRGFDERPVTDIPVHRVHPDTWEWLLSNAPAADKEAGGGHFVRLLLLRSRVVDSQRWGATLTGADADAAAWPRFAHNALSFLETVNIVAQNAAAAQSGAALPGLGDARLLPQGVAAVEAARAAASGRRGYAELVAGLPDAFVCESMYAADVLAGAPVVALTQRLFVLLPEDPFAAAALIRAVKLAGDSRYDAARIKSIAVDALARNPADETLWTASK